MSLPKNNGLDWQRELAERTVDDWIFGAISAKCIAEIPPTDRINSLPAGELQYSNMGDMMDCASRGPVNMLETKFNWLIKNNFLSARSIDFLRQFMNDQGRIEISDAFVAIKSGTTKYGNTMKAPLEAIRIFGIVPKKLMPLESWMKWEDYHNPNRITPAIEAIGKKSIFHFNFNYERILEGDIKTMLDRDILDLAGYAWPEPVNGEYPRSDNDPNHIFMGLKNPPTSIFDNYLDQGVAGDFIKKLVADYRIWGQYRIIISENMTPIENLTLQVSFLQRMIDILKKLIILQTEINKRISGFFKGIFKRSE